MRLQVSSPMLVVVDLVQGTGYSLVGYPANSIFSIPFAGLDGEGLPTYMNENW